VSYLAAEPSIHVTDFGSALTFYQQALGFTVVETYGEPAFFCLLAAGPARLALVHVDTPVVDPERAAREDILAVTLTLSGRDALDAAYARALHAGAAAHLAPIDRPWGARNAILRDPSGNLILLAA
jgi:uncharacterized glyoxalase superfamily protein PhnB